jgi:hypothetical protein
MKAGPEAAGESLAGRPASSPYVVPAWWFLMPLAWCVWLLVWLAPTFLMAPHLTTARPWWTPDTAPAAVAVAAALFLSVIWPFWPAMARGCPLFRPLGKGDCTSGTKGTVPISKQPEMGTAPFIGRSLLEAAILVGLAAPFVLVAAALAGRPVPVARLAVAAVVLIVWGLGLRLAAAAWGPRSARWLIAAALFVAAAPVMIWYANSETLGANAQRVVELSPVIAAGSLATDGWPSEPWPWFAEVALWPIAGMVLALAGVVSLSRRKS